MEELLKYAVEGGAFGFSLYLVIFLFKKFITKQIIEPIQELKDENVEIKKGFLKFTENINEFIFRILKSHNDVAESVNKNVSGMNQLFVEATRHTSQAKLDSHEALEKVNDVKKETDKVVVIASKVHEKNEKIHSEVRKLSNDMVMIKSKLGIKKEDDES